MYDHNYEWWWACCFNCKRLGVAGGVGWYKLCGVCCCISYLVCKSVDMFRTLLDLGKEFFVVDAHDYVMLRSEGFRFGSKNVLIHGVVGAKSVVSSYMDVCLVSVHGSGRVTIGMKQHDGIIDAVSACVCCCFALY